MIETIIQIIKWINDHRDGLFKAFCGLSVGLLILHHVYMHDRNETLVKSLEMAQNNIEAYQGQLATSQQAFNVLKLDMEELSLQNDSVLLKLDSVRQELKIKNKEITTAATQTQVINVTQSKGVGGELSEIIKDTVFTDSIKYNDLTTVYYNINNDSISVGLDIKNTQYLYIYTKREYKNKKSFLKRLFTLDFKKVNKYKYDIKNTNDLLNTKDVRIVESIDK